jgi:hypothetical protein
MVFDVVQRAQEDYDAQVRPLDEGGTLAIGDRSASKGVLAPSRPGQGGSHGSARYQRLAPMAGNDQGMGSQQARGVFC